MESEPGRPFEHSEYLTLSWMSGYPFLASLAVGGFVAWLWWYRQAQRSVPGPNGWPLIGCTIELVPKWGRVHDFFLEQFSDTTKTFYLPFGYPHVGVYTVDPANVEYILKTNFSNYPKVSSIMPPCAALVNLGFGVLFTCCCVC